MPVSPGSGLTRCFGFEITNVTGRLDPGSIGFLDSESDPLCLRRFPAQTWWRATSGRLRGSFRHWLLHLGGCRTSLVLYEIVFRFCGDTTEREG